MPPKKAKQQQIDLATLPECKSLNSILLAKGKKPRAHTLIERIHKEAEKFITKIKKSEVLQHAKQKNIYIDPATLTDKQKKDPKFMESINTELTAEVIAKATQSLINTLNIKVRIEKKAQGEKPIQDERKYDMLYLFEDFPETKQEFEELAKIGENISYVFVLDPKISWQNAPQIVEQEPNDDGEPVEEDQEIKQYKILLQKEEKTQEDHEFQAKASHRISEITRLRSISNPASQFRNTTISVIDSEIDPYNQEASIKQLVKQFFDNLNKLYLEFSEFLEWKKDKATQKIEFLPQEREKKAIKGQTPMEMLLDIVQAISGDHHSTNNEQTDEQEALRLIQSFSLEKPNLKKKEKQITNEQAEIKNYFYNENQEIKLPIGTQNYDQLLRSHLKYPGIDRYQMPEIPTKSSNLRKALRCDYAPFLKNLTLPQFQRRLNLLLFEEYLKEFDEDRSYSLSNRIYEEHHNKNSLEREIFNASLWNEYQLFTKYNEISDKLFVMMVYKCSPRRISKKLYESSWKVLPNYESWLKYFKNNEANLNNTQYFDIDYEKIGNIFEDVKAYSVKCGQEGGVIIDKGWTVAGKKDRVLYGLKGNHSFGVDLKGFWSANGDIRVFHHDLHNQKHEYQTIINLTGDRKIRINSIGNVILQTKNDKRLITPEGYTVLYSQKPIILHPQGCVTSSATNYTNELGYGLQDGHLHHNPTLLRRTDDCTIIKRDDQTVIIEKETSKWIKFADGTEYLNENGKIKIEKEGLPFITCEGNNITICTNEMKIILEKTESGSYKSQILYEDFNIIEIDKDQILVSVKGEVQKFDLNLKNASISCQFAGERLEVRPQNSTLVRSTGAVNPLEDESLYTQKDILPADYIEPRLFIINPADNTGIELLSQKMIDYFSKQKGMEKIVESVDKKDYVHFIRKIDNTQPKGIQVNFEVKLDVFLKRIEPQQKIPYELNKVRTLIKYNPLTEEDIKLIQQIRGQVDEWKKSLIKLENQYGYRNRNDPVTKEKISQKIAILKSRKLQDIPVSSENLKENAINLHFKKLEQNRLRTQREQNQMNLRRQYNKKRDTIKQQYPWNGKLKSKSVIEEMIFYSEPGFYEHYFITAQGKKALEQMPEWVFRPKQVKQHNEQHQQIINQLNNTSKNMNNQAKQEELSDQQQRYDTVQVQLNPMQTKQIYIKPSVFTKREIDEQRRAFEQQKKSYQYHEMKRKDFDLYGRERAQKPSVSSLLRTQPISEINQKYLVTEAPLDRKVKISSMKNKLTSEASSLVEMRKEGPHSALLKTLDKGNDINRLLEKRTMMVQADLNDKLQRDILINPVQANFGIIKEGRSYQIKIEVKNEDVIAQRVTVKRPKTIHCKAFMDQMGPIALGLTKKISVHLNAVPEIIGKFADSFEIVTKHEIYHIPITAHIISQAQQKSLEDSKLLKGVKEISKNKKKQFVQLPPIK